MGERKLQEVGMAAPEETSEVGLEEARDIIVAQSYLATKIPDALRLAEPEDTAHAIRPAVQACVMESVRRHPEVFAEALFPILIPALKRMIRDALQRLIVAIDDLISVAFTRQGILWRWEAFRSGRPFPEVVLRHTLVFRVDDVLLVHQPSGILLTSVTRRHREHMDQIAGMLTAIRDFGADALAVKSGEVLRKIEYGDRAILMEGTNEVSLAVVVRGNPPVEFRESLAMLRARILALYGDAIRGFQGDVSRFSSCEDILELCLVEKARDPSAQITTVMRRSRIKSMVISLALLAVILVSSAFYVSFERRSTQERILGDYLDRLAAVPGVVFIQTSDKNGEFEVKILKDHMVPSSKVAPPPGVQLSAAPFISTDPEIIKTKLSRVLNPPPGVYWTFLHGILSLHGVAPRSWVAHAIERARSVPGVYIVETADLETRDAD